ncbi:MAG: L,D-transpeptidase family protein, partial [Candidatus Tectomicrobia bacterium]|nr:L,D-transpeptidase family protein [Candidatus Tectomicrobia bacterium]
VDGRVGPATRTTLQIPIEDRLRQLIRNLDRWRWLPHNLGARYILVNIPAFTLHVVEHNRPVMTMRVVVGKPSWPTPVLRGLLSSVVLNPTWDIPSSMAQHEIIPRIQRDPSYLTTHNIALIQGKGENATVIAPNTIDWSQAPSPHFPYRLHQQPGPTNPLGRVKFMLANPFQITLHDTPSRELFAKAMRAKSHGCIRLEKPIALAEYLLQADPTWTRTTLLDAIARGESQQVFLPAPIPVYLIYHTTWADADGRVHFRPDIYGWDTDLSPMPDERQPAACR